MKRIFVFFMIVISLAAGSTVSGFCATKYRNYSLNLNADNILAVKLEAFSYDKSYAKKYNYSTEDRDEVEYLVSNINSMYVKTNKGYLDFSDESVRYDLTLVYENKSVVYSVRGTYITVDHTGDVKYIVNKYDFSALLTVFEKLKAEKAALDE